MRWLEPFVDIEDLIMQLVAIALLGIGVFLRAHADALVLSRAPAPFAQAERIVFGQRTEAPLSEISKRAACYRMIAAMPDEEMAYIANLLAQPASYYLPEAMDLIAELEANP